MEDRHPWKFSQDADQLNFSHHQNWSLWNPEIRVSNIPGPDRCPACKHRRNFGLSTAKDSFFVKLKINGKFVVKIFFEKTPKYYQWYHGKPGDLSIRVCQKVSKFLWHFRCRVNLPKVSLPETLFNFNIMILSYLLENYTSLTLRQTFNVMGWAISWSATNFSAISFTSGELCKFIDWNPTVKSPWNGKFSYI